MNETAEQQPQTPPGVIATLTAGFELTTAHIWLILLPCLLDLFYWVGPRLSVAKIAESSLSSLLAEPQAQEAVTQLLELTARVNLFTSLSVPIIGIPALMSGAAPEQTPLPASVYEVDRMLVWFAVSIFLSLIGLFIAAIYLSLIGLAMKEKDDRPQGLTGFATMVIRSTARLIGLGIVFVVLLLMVWLPLLPIAFLGGLITGGLFVLVMLGGLVLVITYLSLSVPGIVLNGRPLLRSVLESIRLVHGNAMQTTNLLLLVVLIGAGTNRLWHLADDGSWLTLVSIAGHAFISTALAAAIFVFYRDRWARVQARQSAV